MNFFKKDKPYQKIPEAERMAIIERSCKQVSRGVFFSTIIIIASFLPVFLLTGQEGKLFHPLAYTKTFILIVDAFLVITLAPVLISFFMKGKFRPESANPVNRFLERIYEPVIRTCIQMAQNDDRHQYHRIAGQHSAFAKSGQRVHAGTGRRIHTVYAGYIAGCFQCRS